MASLTTDHYEPPISISHDDGMLPSSAVVSISVSSGRVAWASSNGMLHVSSMDKIYHAAEECRLRMKEDEDGDEQEESKHTEDPGASSPARKRQRSEPSGSIEHRRRDYDGCLEGVIIGQEGSRSTYDARGRIDDIAWEPLSEGRIAIGSSGSGLTLVDLSKESYRKLSINSNIQWRINRCLWLSKPSDTSAGGAGGGGGQGPASCLLAVSDERSIHLFDPRKSNTPTSRLSWNEPLASPVESLSGGNLLCAVACKRKLLVWDLRKGGSSLGGLGGGGVRVLGASGPVQHGLLSCQDLTETLTSAAWECLSSPSPSSSSSSSSSFFGQEISRQGSVPQGPSSSSLPPLLSWVQQVEANPYQPSLLALVMHNTSVAFYDLATASVTRIHLAPQLLHSSTRQSLSSLRFINQGCFRGAWNSHGSLFWSPSLHVQDRIHESRASISIHSTLWFDVSRSNYSGDQALPPIQGDPFANPTSNITADQDEIKPDRSLRYGGAGAGVFDPRTKHRSEDWSFEARLRKKAFKAGGLLGKLAEIAPSLQATGLDPDKMLPHLTRPSTLAPRASLVSQAAAAALSSMDEDNGSSEMESAARAAVSEWEDARRRRCGPSLNVSLSDWPLCFASCQGYGWGSDDMLGGLAGGRLGVIRGHRIT